ncbi:MAG: hypothetical protein HY951_11200 [Bacteroidia bacterium]|nr:hypothetical protein [Bacteroidia bacterium]
MKNKIIVGLLLVVILVSCRKETGPKGETGAQGNANVKTTIIEAGQWDASPQNNTFETVLQVPDITTEIMNNGTVQVFLWIGGANSSGSNYGWCAVPYSTSYQSFYFNYYVDMVTVNCMFVDSSLVENPGMKKFKVVVIGGQ